MAIPSIIEPACDDFLKGVEFGSGLFLNTPEAADFRLHVELLHDPDHGWQPRAVVRHPNNGSLTHQQVWDLLGAVKRIYESEHNKYKYIVSCEKLNNDRGTHSVFVFTVVERGENGAQFDIEV